MAPRPWAAVLASCLAGCAAPGPSYGLEPTPGLPEAVELDLGSFDCSTSILFSFPDRGRVYPWLPPGFHPREPQNLLLDIPVAVARAGLMLAAESCRGPEGEVFDVGILGVLVEPPDLTEAVADSVDFFVLSLVTESELLLGPLRDAGWDPVEAEVTSILIADGGSLDPSASLAIGRGRAADGDGLLFSLSVYAPASLPEAPWRPRFWHVDGDGWTFLEHEFQLRALAGAATCALREGSPAAHAFSSTMCPPADPSVGAILPQSATRVGLVSFDAGGAESAAAGPF